MKLIADLHIHSHYSRATSTHLIPSGLERWARIKGIGLLGTGDCTHPLWLEECRRDLDDAGEGFYTLKKEVRDAFDAGPAMMEGLPQPGKTDNGGEWPRFVLTGEISTIYKKGGKVRKIHHLVILPDFRAAAAFNARLEETGGNIRSDGRPILGIDSRDLLALLLEADERALLIPAHIWTPWFSALGAKSGFDSIEECYGDLTKYIPAVETGLSSNPPMNWALRSLDKFSIISNSDAHSPEKLGREATIFDMELSYSSLSRALFRQPALSSKEPLPCSSAVLGTVEFFPQEGKYHYDGHRKCGVSLNPEEASKKNYLCPVCGKALTRGVMGRVLELADRAVNEEEPCPPDYRDTNRRPYHSLIPLREIAAEILGTGAASKKTTGAYYRLIEKGGSEFAILMDMSRSELEKTGIPELPGAILAEAIMKMRAGEVFVSPGYDGEYGTVRVFASGAEMDGAAGGQDLFGEPKKESEGAGKSRFQKSQFSEAPAASAQLRRCDERASLALPRMTENPAKEPAAFTPDKDQEKAISYNGKETIIIAGPGTGKTAVLGARIARIIKEGVDPASILALTFTVKAAAELRERIDRLCGPAYHAALTAATFHSFCCSVLREHSAEAGLSADFKILGEEERNSLLRETGGKRERLLGSYIEERKRYLLLPGEEFPKLPLRLTPEQGEIPPPSAELEPLYAEYRRALKESRSLDFEDLSAGTVRLLASRPEILESYRERFRHVFVDEYQDINFAQYALIRILASGDAGSPSLWVIGDPNQAIYGFRGADKRFIDSFLRDYTRAGRFELSTSFRCAEPIISAAAKLTGTRLRGRGAEDSAPPNPTRLDSVRLDSGAVSLYRTQYATEKSEAEGIARIIAGLIGGTSFFAMDSGSAADGHSPDDGFGHEDCAILVRTAALAAPIVKALKDHGIPYELSGEVPWWKEEAAAALIDILRERLKTGEHLSAGDLSRTDDLIRSARDDIAGSGRPGRNKKKISDAVEKLVSLAGLFGDLGSLLDMLDSGAASGILGEGSASIRSSGVKVMTIHASKGLEFAHVFVAALEEGILPFTLYDKAGEKSGDRRPEAVRIEEERRLLYVAMTRAKQGLWLSCSQSRIYRGRKLNAAPSRFLSELEKIIPLARTERPRRDGQLSLF